MTLKELAATLRNLADRFESDERTGLVVRTFMDSEAIEGPPTEDGWKTFKPSGRQLIVIRVTIEGDADRDLISEKTNVPFARSPFTYGLKGIHTKETQS